MSLLNRFKIKAWLILLVALPAVSLVAATTVSALSLHGKMLADREDKLRSIAETGSGLAQSLEADVAAGRISHSEALSRFSPRCMPGLDPPPAGFPPNAESFNDLHPHQRRHVDA